MVCHPLQSGLTHQRQIRRRKAAEPSVRAKAPAWNRCAADWPVTPALGDRPTPKRHRLSSVLLYLRAVRRRSKSLNGQGGVVMAGYDERASFSSSGSFCCGPRSTEYHYSSPNGRAAESRAWAAAAWPCSSTPASSADQRGHSFGGRRASISISGGCCV